MRLKSLVNMHWKSLESTRSSARKNCRIFTVVVDGKTLRWMTLSSTRHKSSLPSMQGALCAFWSSCGQPRLSHPIPRDESLSANRLTSLPLEAVRFTSRDQHRAATERSLNQRAGFLRSYAKCHTPTQGSRRNNTSTHCLIRVQSCMIKSLSLQKDGTHSPFVEICKSTRHQVHRRAL
jgi:hypothetical protein